MVLTQITQTQKKIIIATTVVVIAFIVFWLFIYAPAKRRMVGLKAQLQAKEQEVKDIQMMAAQGGTLEESITLLNKRFVNLEDKFPAKEEEALRKISDFARQLRIDIISIQPESKHPVSFKQEGPLGIDQRVCQSIFIAIDLRCSYGELVRYIELLRQELPALITVEKLAITRERARESRRLKVDLGFNLYLLS